MLNRSDVASEEEIEKNNQIINDFTTRWNAFFQKELVIIATNANEIVIHYNNNQPFSTHKIKQAQAISKAFFNITRELRSFSEEGEKIQALAQPDSQRQKTQVFLDAINKKFIIDTAYFQVSLNKILALHFESKHATEKNKRNSKKEWALLARDHIRTAQRVYTEYESVMRAEGNVQNLKGMVDRIEKLALIYDHDHLSTEEKKNILLLKQAHETKDKDLRFEKFQKVIDASTDPVFKFRIYIQQASTNLYEKLSRKSDGSLTNGLNGTAYIEHQVASIKKTMQACVNAAELLPLVKDLPETQDDIETLGEGLIEMMDLYLNLSQQAAIEKKFMERKKFLIEGLEVLKKFQKIPAKTHFARRDQVAQSLFSNLKWINNEIATLELQKKQKEEAEENRKKVLTDYNLEFNNLLLSFGFTVAPKAKPKKEKYIASANENENNSSPISFDVEEEEDIYLIDVEFSAEEKTSQAPKAILTDLIEKLELAKQKNDIQEKINFSMHLAELSRDKGFAKIACHNIEKGLEHLNTSKKYFGECIHYLAICQRTQPEFCRDKKEWALRILEDVNTKINHTVNSQINKVKKLNKIHQEVKRYIINKYGEKGWKKFDKFDWNLLSPEAKFRLQEKQNLKSLKDFRTDVREVQVKLKSEWASEIQHYLLKKHGFFQPQRDDALRSKYQATKNWDALQVRDENRKNIKGVLSHLDIYQTRSATLEDKEAVDTVIKEYEHRKFGRY